jgi:hypothetical protein
MKDALKAAFGQNVSTCIQETNNVLIEVYDCYDCEPDRQRSYIKTAKTHPVHFILQNPSQATLVFAAIDNCILPSSAVARCDFAIGNFQRLFLVEVKQVSMGQRSTARSAATHQLSSTLTLLRAHIPLHSTDLVAVICLKAAQAYPVQSARKVAERVRFKEEFSADLVEGQSAIF